MIRTLIVRHSRIGDAIIPLPLIRSLAQMYPADDFTVVSNSRLECLFDLMPDNVHFVPMVTKAYTGVLRNIVFQLKRKFFFKRLKKSLYLFDRIVVLQNDTIARFISSCVNERSMKVSIVDESPFHSIDRQVNGYRDGMTMIGLYKELFLQVGYENLDLVSTPSLQLDALKAKNITELVKRLGVDLSKKLITIAPFSQEISKTYSTDRMEEVVAYFASQADKYQILMLGGGTKEQKVAEAWQAKYPAVVSLIGKASFCEEVDILARSSIGLTMDSSNLHLLSFLNVPVVSVWGATAPHCGFYPQKEPLSNTVSLNLPCQPCSVMGGKECSNSNVYQCLDIPPRMIIERLESVLGV